ncbi:MAG: response regulator transcription factor [Chloroflexota bacterium]|nr:response regulator transcription factor [Chloroflexota bacterium]
MTTGPWRVLIVDADARVRRGLRALLEGEPDIVVVGEAATAAQALRCDLALHPSVILLDLMLPTIEDGLEAVRCLAAQRRCCIATSWRDSLRDAVLAVGASGFIEKGASPEIVRAAIRAECRTGGCLAPSRDTCR